MFLRRQTVALSGTGVAGPGVSLLPASLTYARTGVGVVGADQTLTLTNNGGSPVLITAVTVVGDFGILSGTGSTCQLGTTISVGSTCTLQIAFLPTGAGLRTGSVTILSSAPTQTAQLSGTGVDFQLVPNGDTTVHHKQWGATLSSRCCCGHWSPPLTPSPTPAPAHPRTPSAPSLRSMETCPPCRPSQSHC